MEKKSYFSEEAYLKAILMAALLALLLDDITTIKPCKHAKKANLLLDDRGWCNNMKMAFSLATIYYS